MSIYARLRSVAAVLAMPLLALSILSTLVQPASAFKPYTHTSAAQQVMDDLGDGTVSIGGRSYAVNANVRAAIQRWPDHYRAGTIGPDGFPDIVYGQALVHPTKTGEWLEYLHAEAWRAQRSSRYNSAEKGQILAFAYGYLGHAAGDMWSHTLVNDLSLGVFPELSNVLGDVGDASIAIRHIIVEGYIADATPGYDGNENYVRLANGDYSTDSTPEQRFAAPHRWIYDVLVNPDKPLPVGTCGDRIDDDGDGVADDGCPGSGPFTVGDTPEAQRGALVDFFLDLQSTLELRSARLLQEIQNPGFTGPDCSKKTINVSANTVRGRRTDSIRVRKPSFFCKFPRPVDPRKIAEREYIKRWIDDIDSKLSQWNRVGLAISDSLFDPQTYRDVANQVCKGKSGTTRQRCEENVGYRDVIGSQIDPLLNDFLLSMMGAPDITGNIREFSALIEEILKAVLGPAIDPIVDLIDEVDEFIEQLIIDHLEELFGIDIELLTSFLKDPAYWMGVERTSMDLGGLGRQRVQLFRPGTRDYLDKLLGLGPNPHVVDVAKIPGVGSIRTVRLADNATFGKASPFAAFDNATTMTKLSLLGAGSLNNVIKDQLVAEGLASGSATVSTYRDGTDGVPANIMIDGLGGNPWLQNIDSDHAWRSNGWPRFAPGRENHGGNGLFPLWESCNARPAFRSLFTDWERDPFRYSALMSIGEPGGVFSDLRDPCRNVGDLNDPNPDPDPDPDPDSGGDYEIVRNDKGWTLCPDQRFRIYEPKPNGTWDNLRNYSNTGNLDDGCYIDDNPTQPGPDPDPDPDPDGDYEIVRNDKGWTLCPDQRFRIYEPKPNGTWDNLENYSNTGNLDDGCYIE